MRRRPPLLAVLAFGLVWLTDAAAAQAQQYFGRNKVQYQSFDFKIIRTQHFDVYYYPQERTAAMDAARMAERSYARLSRLLQHEFHERKPILLYASHSDFQQTNALPGFLDESTGGVTEPIKDRVILPFTGSYADFEHVLTHELVHAFQFDIMFRRGAMLDGSPQGERLPLWFMEGMAEYLSVGRIDPLTASWVRDAVLSGYMRSVAEMSRRDDYLSYRFGQSLWHYIGAKWGNEAVGLLLQKTPRMGIERAFVTTLGIPLSQLSDEWLSSVRARYLPQLADLERPDRFARKLTHHDRLSDPWYLAPALSPDGESMVYVSQRGGFSFDLWLADARTGKPKRRLLQSDRNGSLESLRFMSSSAAFSPDGRYIAFAAQTGGRDDLYIYDLRSHRIVRKLRFGLNGITSPSWSPDGKRIVFSGNDGGITDLFVTDTDGALERLTRDRYADLTPAWSPDGTTIAFTTDRGPSTDFARLRFGNYRVALYHLGSGRVELLPHQELGKSINPVWSPDGRELVWAGDRTGNDDLYLYELADRSLYRITDVLSGVIGITPLSPVLSWAKDGRLAMVYFEQAGYNIYAVDDPRKLPRVRVDDAAPALVAVRSDGSAAPLHGSAAQADGAAPRTGEPPARPDDSAPRTGGSTAPTAGPDQADPSTLASHAFRSSIEPSSGVTGGPPAGALSVMEVMDSVASIPPDTTSFQLRDYHVKFTPDVVGRPTVGAQVGGYYGNGVYGGSYIALSDMLGNHDIVAAADVNGSLSDAQFLAAYAFLKRRANLSVSMQQLPLYRYYGGGYFGLTPRGGGEAQQVYANVFVRDVIRSAVLNVSYPFSSFRRMELGLEGVYYKTDVLYRGFFTDSYDALNRTDPIEHFSFAEPFAALVFDNTLFGWTGPVYGHRYRLQVARTLGDFHYAEALLDVRNYFNIHRSFVLATQLFGLVRQGSDADRFSVYWGGPYYIRGYDGGSFDPNGAECRADTGTPAAAATLSGCPARDRLIGSSATFVNVEARFPVIKELQLGALGSFPPVDAVAFFNGGLVWSQSVCTDTDLGALRCAPHSSLPVHVAWKRSPGQDPLLWRTPVYSYGVGLRMNVFYTILRLDYAIPLDRPGRRGVFSISFGPSF